MSSPRQQRRESNGRRHSIDSATSFKRRSVVDFAADAGDTLRRKILKGKNLRQGKNNALEAVDEDMASQFETDSMYDDDDFDNIPGRVIEHKWRPCRFKNATFCMVCGKLTSSLGECPEEIPADRNGFEFAKI